MGYGKWIGGIMGFMTMGLLELGRICHRFFV